MAATDWKEIESPDEAERFERYARILGDLQSKAAGGKPLRRGLHAKQHAGLVARLDVRDDLSPELAQGLFATPGSYDAYVRLSNGAGRVQSDELPDVRGVGLKILGVDGRKIIPGLEDAKTQDFLFIQTPASPFRGPDEFVTFVKAASGSPALLLPRLGLAFGPFAGVGLVRRVLASLRTSGTSFGEQRFFTAAPVQWGPYAAKLRLAAVDVTSAPAIAKGPTRFAEDLALRVRTRPLTYELSVQLYIDARSTPIEDASIAWDEATSPFRAVGQLTIAAQDPASEKGKRVAAYVDRLSFDPWHALREHRPLGAVMRARNYAYRVSTAQRGAIDERTVELLA